MASKKRPSRPDVTVFIREYLRDPNGPKAAIAAGYSAKTAASQASRLLKSVKVRQEIDKADAERLAKVQEETGITLARTLREISRLAYFDPRMLFDAEGEPKAITELDDDTAAAIAGLESATERARDGGESAGATYIRKYKVADKKGALDMLMKHLGGYAVDNAQKVDPLVSLIERVQGSALKPAK